MAHIKSDSSVGTWILCFPIIQCIMRFFPIIKQALPTEQASMIHKKPTNKWDFCYSTFSLPLRPRIASIEGQIITHLICMHILDSLRHRTAKRKIKLLLLKQQGNKKGFKLLLNSARSCEFNASVAFLSNEADRSVERECTLVMALMTGPLAPIWMKHDDSWSVLKAKEQTRYKNHI